MDETAPRPSPTRLFLLALALALPAAAAEPPGAHAPLAPSELATTEGAIALGNLDAQIAGEERLARRRPLTVKQRAAIADLIAMRGQFRGRIADYEESAARAERLVRDAPDDGLAYLARAHARALFHRFPEALADLDAAEQRGVRGARVDGARAAILQATGRYDEALAIRARAAAERPDITTLGALASLRSERGDVAEAERLFVAAQYHYRDVSPFPLAWLWFQQGLMWMREGRLERARELFAAAHARLPQFAAAQGHLAEVEAALGRRDRAVALLTPLARRSDDPDYAAQLARILGEAGRRGQARPWRAAAARRYDALLRRHPQAFADHGAEFWLAAGADPKRALALAQANLALRPTPRAFEIALKAALAAADASAACTLAERADAVPHPWPTLVAVTESGHAACPAPAAVCAAQSE